MHEGYSREKLNWAKKESLSPEELERLERFRDTKKRWDEAVRAHSPGLIGAVVDAWKEFRTAIRWSQFQYEALGGEKEHKQLEYAHGETKEGQMELAQEEAEFFNKAFDIRLARLDEARKHHNDNPAEFEEAYKAFNELVKDLNETNLRQYEAAIYSRRLAKQEGVSLDEDLKPNKPGDIDRLRTYQRYKRGEISDGT